MLFSPSAHSASLAPRIGDDVLPTPAEEWAETTVTSIKLSADLNSLVLPPSRSSTPRVPGAYPSEGESDYSRGIAFHQGYISTQKHVVDAVVGAGASARRYLPGWASYLSPSTIGPQDVSQTGYEKTPSPLTYPHAANLSFSNSIEPFPNHMSAEHSANSAPSLHNDNEIDKSYLTLNTSQDGEHRSLSDITTKTINGSPLSSPSRYSSQSSLTKPMNRLLHSSSENADTTHHGSESGEMKNNHEKAFQEAGTDRYPTEHSDSRSGQVACRPGHEDDAIQHSAGSDTPIGSPYPAFLGPVDSADKQTEQGLPNGVFVGSSTSSASSKKTDYVPDMGRMVGVLQGVRQPLVNSQVRTHPLAGSRADGTSNDGTAMPRLRTTSVVFDKLAKSHQKHERPASEEYTSGVLASGGTRAQNTGSSTSGLSRLSRASFMDKLKGEMKVISGRLSHDGAKVEEGRRLMGKIA